MTDLDVEKDLKFSFRTKGEVLENLSGVIFCARFPDQIIVTVNSWQQNRETILDSVLANFSDCFTVVRSSGINEDQWDTSQAGKFLSLIGVAPDRASMEEAIQKVIDSFDDDDPEHQVLVQPKIEDVAMSGVVMTRDLDTGAPYWIVNYDDVTGRTDTVTSGAESKSLRILRGHTDSVQSPRIAMLLVAVREIEEATANDRLDIEFCITENHDLYILQVRPIAAHRHWGEVKDEDVFAVAEEIRDDVANHMEVKPGILGTTTIFGEMSDWNPAEMIGTTPRPLALSLYKHLITDSTWGKARAQMGYRDMSEFPLLTSFSGRPYIDIRLSLNSFLPDGLDQEFAEELIDFQLGALANNREYHDKIEFKIASTCLHFDFDSGESELRSAGFTAAQVADLRQRLQKITLNAVQTYSYEHDRLLGLTRSLRNHGAVTGNEDFTEGMQGLLSACITNGTLPFSILARHGFIAMSLLNSMVARGVLSDDDSARFLRNVETVTEELVADMDRLSQGSMTLDDFLAVYGHLRPSTYDILSLRYDERPSLLQGHNVRPFEPAEDFKLSAKQEKGVRSLLDEIGADLSVDELFGFIRSATQAREEAKFHFTKSVSDGLQALVKWGDETGLDRETVSWLTISNVLDNKPPSELRELGDRSRETMTITRSLHLPTLIINPDDVHVVRFPLEQPTFVTNKRVSAEVLVLTAVDDADIDGKIVAIENADPGFDWIFSRSIEGLITKYGGSNSHMAIRCAEFGLPAAIGCGQRLFNDFSRARIIEIDAAHRKLHVVAR